MFEQCLGSESESVTLPGPGVVNDVDAVDETSLRVDENDDVGFTGVAVPPPPPEQIDMNVNRNLMDDDIDVGLYVGDAAPPPPGDLQQEALSCSDIIAPSRLSVGTQKEASFCAGFKPQLLGSVYDSFPFHLLKNSDVSFSDEAFHSKSCRENKFLLLDKCESVNKCCEAIGADPKWIKLVADANDPERYLSTAKDEHMTLHQLRQRLTNQRTRLNSMKLKSLNMRRTLDRVNKTFLILQKL